MATMVKQYKLLKTVDKHDAYYLDKTMYEESSATLTILKVDNNKSIEMWENGNYLFHIYIQDNECIMAKVYKQE